MDTDFYMKVQFPEESGEAASQKRITNSSLSKYFNEKGKEIQELDTIYIHPNDFNIFSLTDHGRKWKSAWWKALKKMDCM